jgi:hypothetical protein
MEDESRPFVGELEREVSMMNVWKLRNREGLSTCETAREHRMWRSKTSRDIMTVNMMFPS